MTTSKNLNAASNPLELSSYLTNASSKRHLSDFDQSSSKASRVSILAYGAGDDIISAGNQRNTILAGDGRNLITVGNGNNRIFAGSGRDFLQVGDGDNTISLGGGDNSILAGNGNNLIDTGAGNDVIFTGAGNSIINAGDGNNLINAGTGNDTVYLGAGNDRLILEAGKGSVTVIGFDVKSDKLRSGQSLFGKSFTYTTKGKDTLVYAGKDLLATLKGVASGSPALFDSGVLNRYAATDLGTLADPKGTAVLSVNAASINDFSQIAGRYNTGAVFTNTNTATPPVTSTTNAVRQGFIWENGVMTALTSTGKKVGESAYGTTYGAAANGATTTLLTPNINTINDRGIVTGTGDEIRIPVGRATDRALLWDQGKLTINDFGGQESYFLDINQNGLIAGRNILESGYEKPFFSQDGGTPTLLNMGAFAVGDGGTARGVNNKGQIVGYLDKDGALNDTIVNTAIVWTKDDKGEYQLKDLGTFGSQQATLRDVNNAGQIIGATSDIITPAIPAVPAIGTTPAVPAVAAVTASTPFLIQADGTFVALGSLGGTNGSVNGINEFGTVVGASQIADKTNHAFVWSNGVMTDLNSLVSSPLKVDGATVTLTSATSINNFGEISATGTYSYKDAAGKTAIGTRSYVLKIA